MSSRVLLRAIGVVFIASAAAGLSPAQAQLPTGLLGSAAGSLMPRIAGASSWNVTGVLGYCIKNKFLGGSGGASGVLSRLTGQPGTTSSPDYQTGLAGTLLNGRKSISGTSDSNAATMLGGLSGSSLSNSKGLSLDSLPSGIRNKLCDAVLTQAKSLL